MSYTVRLSHRAAICVDVIKGGESQHITPGLLLTIEGRGNEVMNCAIVPRETIRALIATLQLAEKQFQS